MEDYRYKPKESSTVLYADLQINDGKKFLIV